MNTQYVCYVEDEETVYGPFENEAAANAWAQEYTSGDDGENAGEIKVLPFCAPPTE